jgi:hypothetical protein
VLDVRRHAVTRPKTRPKSRPRPHPPLTPYAEQPEWSELWEACVTVLDRYPHIRPPAPVAPPVHQRVHIPQRAVAAADVHYHLE